MKQIVNIFISNFAFMKLKPLLRFLLVFPIWMLWCCLACANDIIVTNLVLVNTDRGKGTTDVQFDLSWRNSWRASWEDTLYDGTTAVITNWDAAWVFVKFREPGGDWRHASLADDGHEAPSGIAVTVGESAGSNVGAFVYRSVTGYGELDLAKVRLRWLYTEDGAPLRTAIDLRPLRA